MRISFCSRTERVQGRGKARRKVREKRRSLFSGLSQSNIIIGLKMGVPYFKVRWHKAERPRAVEILPPRGWDFTHPCNRWMKRGPVWVCGRQSSKAHGESRSRAPLSFSARSKGGVTSGGLGAHPVEVDLPSRADTRMQGECREKESKPGSQARKGTFIRGK